MARKYRKSRRLSQKQYRARLAKYKEHRAKTGDSASFREWNAQYRQTKFLRKEYKLYSEMFDRRQKSARYGFRKTDEGKAIEKYDFKEFKQYYYVTRNSLKEEVQMGERSRVGSVITEMVNDQAYELSAAKANAVANYLIRNEREFLIEKGIIVPDAVETEDGRLEDLIKSRNLRLLVRQGSFIKEEVGLWEEISQYYQTLIDGGMTAKEAKRQIGVSYFNSPK